jgi:hypothetical protein
MAMLEAGGMGIVQDGARQADEDNPRGYFEDERVKELLEGQGEWLGGARGKAVKVVSLLLEKLPRNVNYKVIFMTRHLDEVLASQRRMLERRGEAPDISDERMKELWTDHLRRVSNGLSLDPAFDSIEVAYTDILEDPWGCAERMRAFIDVPLDCSRMAEVVDKTLYRNRQRE